MSALQNVCQTSHQNALVGKLGRVVEAAGQKSSVDGVKVEVEMHIGGCEGIPYMVAKVEGPK